MHKMQSFARQSIWWMLEDVSCISSVDLLISSSREDCEKSTHASHTSSVRETFKNKTERNTQSNSSEINSVLCVLQLCESHVIWKEYETFSSLITSYLDVNWSLMHHSQMKNDVTSFCQMHLLTRLYLSWHEILLTHHYSLSWNSCRQLSKSQWEIFFHWLISYFFWHSFKSCCQSWTQIFIILKLRQIWDHKIHDNSWSESCTWIF